MAEGRRSTARDAVDGEGGDGGEVELSLGLRTGSSSSAARRKNMTIFFNGRVCAIDVTELQARAIITMANQEILAEQQRRDRDSNQDSSSSSTGGGRQNPKPPALEHAAAPVINHEAAATAGLSMKRSLQRFLQKRKARAATVGAPYAGGRPAGSADETLGEG